MSTREDHDLRSPFSDLHYMPFIHALLSQYYFFFTSCVFLSWTISRLSFENEKWDKWEPHRRLVISPRGSPGTVSLSFCVRAALMHALISLSYSRFKHLCLHFRPLKICLVAGLIYLRNADLWQTRFTCNSGGRINLFILQNFPYLYRQSWWLHTFWLNR